MSIPLFLHPFATPETIYTWDGGLLNNTRSNLFDRDKYIEASKRPQMGVETKYYKEENKRFLKTHPTSSRYVYNKETLGFRLDSKQEIGVFPGRCRSTACQHCRLFRLHQGADRHRPGEPIEQPPAQ
jgi:NTE family protein